MSQPVTFSAPAAAGTFTITFQGTSGTLSHTTSANLAVTPPPTQFLVSASYYPWYNGVNFGQAGPCSGGVGALRVNLIPPELPVLGEYDSQDQDVVTQQIAWSTAAGVNVWDLEWVMPNDFLDNSIQYTILTNPHIGDIRFAMFYDYAIRFSSDFSLTPDKVTTIVSDFQYLAAHYFTHPSYLRVGSGRPVVFFYAAVNLTPVSAVQSMVSTLRQAMSAAGFDVYLIGDEYYALNPPDPVRIGNWDAASTDGGITRKRVCARLASVYVESADSTLEPSGRWVSFTTSWFGAGISFRNRIKEGLPTSPGAHGRVVITRICEQRTIVSTWNSRSYRRWKAG